MIREEEVKQEEQKSYQLLTRASNHPEARLGQSQKLITFLEKHEKAYQAAKATHLEFHKSAVVSREAYDAFLKHESDYYALKATHMRIHALHELFKHTLNPAYVATQKQLPFSEVSHKSTLIYFSDAFISTVERNDFSHLDNLIRDNPFGQALSAKHFETKLTELKASFQTPNKQDKHAQRSVKRIPSKHEALPGSKDNGLFANMAYRFLYFTLLKPEMMGPDQRQFTLNNIPLEKNKPLYFKPDQLRSLRQTLAAYENAFDHSSTNQSKWAWVEASLQAWGGLTFTPLFLQNEAYLKEKAEKEEAELDTSAQPLLQRSVSARELREAPERIRHQHHTGSLPNLFRRRLSRDRSKDKGNEKHLELDKNPLARFEMTERKLARTQSVM